MTKRFVLVVLATQLSLVYAEPVVVTARDDGLELARQVIVERAVSVTPEVPLDRTIYLNKDGVSLTPGINDARANRSSIVTRAVAIPPWSPSEEVWARTVSCLRVMFARFDVRLVVSDPGDVPHVEAVFGGSPLLVGLGPRVAGVAPFSTNCRTVENAIVFAFTDRLPDDPQVVCEVMAQEIAHSFGLDHELLAADPMTYLPYKAARAFQDELAECGEDSPRACGVPGWPACRQKQNSVTLLGERLGVAGEGDLVPPAVSITSPAAGAAVAAGFQVEANISDDISIRFASLSVDGVMVDTLSSPPWTFSTSATLLSGAYRLTVRATDGPNERSHTVNVLVDGNEPEGEGNASFAGCSTSGGGTVWSCALALVLMVRCRRSHRIERRAS